MVVKEASLNETIKYQQAQNINEPVVAVRRKKGREPTNPETREKPPDQLMPSQKPAICPAPKINLAQPFSINNDLLPLESAFIS